MRGTESDGSKKPKAMDPMRLNRFLDSPSTFNVESRDQIEPARDTYRSRAEVLEWRELQYDALCSVIAPIVLGGLTWSRLDTRGKVVVLENDSTHTTVLGTKPAFDPSLRIRSLEENIVARAGAPLPGKLLQHLVVIRPESVENNATVAAATLGYTYCASAQLQEGIMTPAQRRERQQFTTASEKATTLQKRAEMKERRLVQLMSFLIHMAVI
ncbi:hypothetical protein ACHHYP_07346 [Achlya hypogyna]|uniref:Uncharacterized protein n=1 Tax=Achlya hypogyna TaxID=1202772 RepID=A0A1V9ZM21_ACHHY|nr:hypothetical protein ACHHYP_07346 [Achlya hypogyna]